MRLLPRTILTCHRLLPPLLLIAVTLAVYYAVLWSGLHPVDDTGIVSFYSSSPRLHHLLLPGNSYYYRPLVELSFYLDNLLWAMEPSVLHLESILLHCANSLLVYYLARTVCRCCGSDTTGPALFCALIFAVHPVNVEAVAWIAGRADLLMAFLLLSSARFWLIWFEEAGRGTLAAALLLFGAALLTKETAVAFAGVVFLSALAYPSIAGRVRLAVLLGVATLPVVLVAAGVVLAGRGTGAVGRLLQDTGLLTPEASGALLAATGYYIGKLVMPLPLNFAVVEVQPWHGITLFVLVPLLWVLYRRCRPAAVFCGAAVLMILPALVLVVKPIAWTPVAERYLYLPAAFFCVGVAAVVCRWAGERGIVPFCMMLLVGGFALISFQRAVLWGDKEAFFRDAVQKSPGFGSLYNELGGVLLQKGRFDEAEEAFITAERLNRRDSMRLVIKANLLRVRYGKGDLAGVRELFFRQFTTKQGAPAEFLELLYKADDKRLHDLAGRERLSLAQDLLETLELLNRKRYDPFWLYRSGQIALDNGERARAADFFRRAYADAPLDAHYRGAAVIYLKKLETPKIETGS